MADRIETLEDWPAALRDFGLAVADARRRRQQELFENASRAFQLATLPYGGDFSKFAQGNPQAASQTLSEYEKAIRSQRGFEQFAFPRHTQTTQQVAPDQSIGGVLAPSSPGGGPFGAFGGSPPPAPVTTTRQEFDLPQGDPGDRPTREVVRDPATVKFLQDNYPSYLDAPYAKAIAEIPGLRERLARLGQPTVTPDLILAGMKFRPGAEENARATVQALIAQGVTDPLKLRQAVAQDVEAPQSSTQLQEYAQGRIKTAMDRLKGFDDAIRQAATAGNFDQVHALIDRRNRYLDVANQALAGDQAIQRAGIQFQGLPVQQYGPEYEAQVTQGPRRKEAREDTRTAIEWERLGITRQNQQIALAHLGVSQANLSLAAARFKMSTEEFEFRIAQAKRAAEQLTPNERTVLTMWNNPALSPAQRKNLVPQVTQIFGKLNIPLKPEDLTPQTDPAKLSRTQKMWRGVVNYFNSATEKPPGPATGSTPRPPGGPTPRPPGAPGPAAPSSSPRGGRSTYDTPRGQLTVADVTKLIQQAGAKGASKQQIHDALQQMNIPPADFGY